MLLCLDSLRFSINSLQSSWNSLLIWSLSSSIHVSLKSVHMSMVLLMDLICSFASSFSALCNIFTPWGVLMFLFSFRLFGVIFWLRHLKVNLLQLLKLAIMDVFHFVFNSVYDTKVRILNKKKKTNRTNQDSRNSRNNTGFNNNKPYIMVPYVKGMDESCKNICRNHGIEMHFKGGSTF